jgi:spore maturation protein CgeB
MKVLVIGPLYYNFPDSVAWALNQLGHEVTQYNYRGFPGGQPRWIRKLHKIGFRKFERDFIAHWEAGLLALFKDFRPDRCLILNGDWMRPGTLDQIRAAGCHITLWMIDSVLRMPRIEPKLTHCDEAFSFDHRDDAYVRQKFGIACEYCPVGYDPRTYTPAEGVAQDLDVTFVGVAVPHRLALLQKLAVFAKERGIKLAAFGHYWDERYPWKQKRFARRHDPLQDFIHNHYLAPHDAASMYRRSKICLNIHIPDHEGVNPRTFEILGAGAFQLTDRKPKLGELLRDGTDLVIYDDFADLCAKIEHFLHADSERQTIAREGHRHVAGKYSILQSVSRVMGEAVIENPTGSRNP